MATKPRRRLGDLLAGFFDVRQTPSLLGLGLIDTIPEDEIIKNEDPNDLNRDGVRGIASRVTVEGTAEVGRFGWKAEVPRLADFVCRALGGELGLTAPDQGRGFGLAEDGDRAMDPETTQEGLDDIGFFVANLAAPQRGEGRDTWQARRGEALFERIGCAICHVPVLYGTEGPVALYSNLLLHEIQKPEEPASIRRHVVHLGQRKDPEQEEELAAGRLFRTAPLWGVARTAPYLHDGRAKTLHEAVLSHEVEAAWAREGYEALFEADREALMAFLDSL